MLSNFEVGLLASSWCTSSSVGITVHRNINVTETFQPESFRCETMERLLVKQLSWLVNHWLGETGSI